MIFCEKRIRSSLLLLINGQNYSKTQTFNKSLVSVCAPLGVSITNMKLITCYIHRLRQVLWWLTQEK